MKNEFKIVVKAPNQKTWIAEYSTNKKELQAKAAVMMKENPDWNVLVVKEQYNVS